MRPRPIPRKTIRSHNTALRNPLCFNEAAADTAENGNPGGDLRRRRGRFNEAAADTAENENARQHLVVPRQPPRFNEAAADTAENGWNGTSRGSAPSTLQ